MLEISPAKIAHVIVKAREYDAKVGAWNDPTAMSDDIDTDSILEDVNSDATRSELATFIMGLNDDEQANLVAVTWIGRGSYSADEFAEAVGMARAERVNRTDRYLLGIPLLADYLEEGLDKLGYSVEEVESGIL
ncbi:MAG: DUF3775 domain-containing protein [Methyloligellaceae bacterium]